MKSTSHRLLALALLVAGASVGAQKVRPISGNGKPLTFQVVSAAVTQQPQTVEQVDINKMELVQAMIQSGTPMNGGTYRGPVPTTTSYKPIPLTSADSFVVVTFSISNVKRPLELSPRDVTLIDGKGVPHQSFGGRSIKQPNAWSYSDELLAPNQQNASTWLFQVPTDAIGGATIKFQKAAYPLTPAQQ